MLSLPSHFKLLYIESIHTDAGCGSYHRRRRRLSTRVRNRSAPAYDGIGGKVADVLLKVLRDALINASTLSSECISSRRELTAYCASVIAVVVRFVWEVAGNIRLFYRNFALASLKVMPCSTASLTFSSAGTLFFINPITSSASSAGNTTTPLMSPIK